MHLIHHSQAETNKYSNMINQEIMCAMVETEKGIMAAGDVARLVQCLLSTHKALGLTPGSMNHQ